MKQLLGILTRYLVFFSPLEEELKKMQRRNWSLFSFLRVAKVYFSSPNKERKREEKDFFFERILKED